VDSIAEELRLHVLQEFHLLDTPPETTFDQLSDLAKTVTNTPIALITLVDDKSQTFKSAHGVGDLRQTAREHAFCAHALGSDEPLLVRDARRDPRFSDNPLVTGEPFIRFYAGIPLEVEPGVVLGTLCVIDKRPRKLSQAQIDTLIEIRDVLVSQMKLRRIVLDTEMADDIVRMCAWCNDIQLDGSSSGDALWVTPRGFVETIRRVSHGICPQCEGQLRSSGRVDA